jgi:hypothetical protein
MNRQLIGNTPKEHVMIWMIALVMMILWITGLITNYTMSGFIHLLLVFAVVIVLVKIIRGRPLV